MAVAEASGRLTKTGGGTAETPAWKTHAHTRLQRSAAERYLGWERVSTAGRAVLKRRWVRAPSYPIDTTSIANGAELPEFEYRDEHDNELIMYYTSPRKLCHVAEGLIAGATKHFETITL